MEFTVCKNKEKTSTIPIRFNVAMYLEDRQTLREALEQYDIAYDIQEELLTLVRGWEEILSFQYDRIESAASKIDVDLEELRDEEEDEREDEAAE
jgi:hypothetical protein